MRIYWTKEEEDYLRLCYEFNGLSLSELFGKYVEKFHHRTKSAIRLKINKLKLRHSPEQKYIIKSRLNSGTKNGMYGRKGPNIGLTKKNSERIKKASIKLSKIMKNRHNNGDLDTKGKNNGMYGKTPWNKGLDKYSSKKIYEMSLNQSKTRKKIWNSYTKDEQDEVIGRMTLAANKIKKDTKIEIIVENTLKKMNIEYIKQLRFKKFVFDFFIPQFNFVIECQGDYWHGNTEFFNELNEVQLKNVKRDKVKISYLNENEIKFLFLWENEIHKDKKILDKIIWEKLTEIPKQL